MEWRRRHVLGLADFSPEEIQFVVDTAKSMEEVLTRDIKKVPALRGKTVVNLFFEASTRTRTSFEIAGKRLSADVVNFSFSSSSAAKGESLLDTAKNIDAMKPNILVMRHPASGASQHEPGRTLPGRTRVVHGYDDRPGGRGVLPGLRAGSQEPRPPVLRRVQHR